MGTPLEDALVNPAQTVEQSRDTTRVTYRPYAELRQMQTDVEAAAGSTSPRLMRARIQHGTEDV